MPGWATDFLTAAGLTPETSWGAPEWAQNYQLAGAFQFLGGALTTHAPGYAATMLTTAARAGFIPGAPAQFQYQTRMQNYVNTAMDHLQLAQSGYDPGGYETALYNRNMAQAAYWGFEQATAPSRIGWGAARLGSYFAPELAAVRVFGFAPEQAMQQVGSAEVMAPWMRQAMQQPGMESYVMNSPSFWQAHLQTPEEMLVGNLMEWTLGRSAAFGLAGYGVRGSLGIGLMQFGLNTFLSTEATQATWNMWGMHPSQAMWNQSYAYEGLSAGSFAAGAALFGRSLGGLASNPALMAGRIGGYLVGAQVGGWAGQQIANQFGVAPEWGQMLGAAAGGFGMSYAAGQLTGAAARAAVGLGMRYLTVQAVESEIGSGTAGLAGRLLGALQSSWVTDAARMVGPIGVALGALQVMQTGFEYLSYSDAVRLLAAGQTQATAQNLGITAPPGTWQAGGGVTTGRWAYENMGEDIQQAQAWRVSYANMIMQSLTPSHGHAQSQEDDVMRLNQRTLALGTLLGPRAFWANQATYYRDLYSPGGQPVTNDPIMGIGYQSFERGPNTAWGQTWSVTPEITGYGPNIVGLSRRNIRNWYLGPGTAPTGDIYGGGSDYQVGRMRMRFTGVSGPAGAMSWDDYAAWLKSPSSIRPELDWSGTLTGPGGQRYDFKGINTDTGVAYDVDIWNGRYVQRVNTYTGQTYGAPQGFDNEGKDSKKDGKDTGRATQEGAMSKSMEARLKRLEDKLSGSEDWSENGPASSKEVPPTADFIEGAAYRVYRRLIAKGVALGAANGWDYVTSAEVVNKAWTPLASKFLDEGSK